MRISVLGAGAWGTAMALQAAPRHEVVLWGRSAEQVQALQADRANARYLPGVPFPPELEITGDLDAAVRHAQSGLLLIGSPMSGLRGLLQATAVGQPTVWLCKGLEAGTGLMGHEVAAQVRQDSQVGVLSGPSFALEVAQGRPTALVAASASPFMLDLTVQAFHADALRVYTSGDPVGVEIGGAVKNVMAIATGVCDGLGLGQNARAALITRGLAEISRLGLALGARPETFMGLGGLGDLVLTATGDLSRNRRVGLALASGRRSEDILADLGHVAEGVYSARTVARRAADLGVAMPITEAVVALLDGRLTAAQAVRHLLERQARAEDLSRGT